MEYEYLWAMRNDGVWEIITVPKKEEEEYNDMAVN